MNTTPYFTEYSIKDTIEYVRAGNLDAVDLMKIYETYKGYMFNKVSEGDCDWFFVHNASVRLLRWILSFDNIKFPKSFYLECSTSPHGEILIMLLRNKYTPICIMKYLSENHRSYEIRNRAHYLYIERSTQSDESNVDPELLLDRDISRSNSI